MEPSQKSPKLIAVDLDGTFLDHTGEPHARDASALRAAAEAGVGVSILTGRLYSGTRRAAEVAGIRAPVGCADGSHVVHAGSHETLLHRGIGGDDALFVRDTLARHGPATFVFADDAIVHDARGMEHVRYMRTWSTDVRETHAVHAHEVWRATAGVTAVVAIGTSREVRGAAEELEAGGTPRAQLAVFPLRNLPDRERELWALIARAPGGTKGTALAWLAEHHGVDIAETVVVGDWLNDLSMFAVAGRSYAMGQAPDEVKEKATHVLEETSRDGGGIARVVETLFGVRV